MYFHRTCAFFTKILFLVGVCNCFYHHFASDHS